MRTLLFILNQWAVMPVDVGAGYTDVGPHPSLALNRFNNPCIAYNDYTTGTLRYAWWNGASYEKQTIDAAGGTWTSIALDSQDRPCIAYKDGPNRDLKYAWWNGTSWQVEAVDTTGDVGSWASLALDSQDRPCISYYDWTNRDLKYARWDGTSWLIEAVDTAGWVGYVTSLTLDSQDRPHISYYGYLFAGNAGDLKYAYHDGVSWQIQFVDTLNGAGEWSSIALDSQDRPHIAYLSWSPKTDLKYAWWNGTSWEIVWVDTVGAKGLFPSIALDSQDRPHIAYYDSIDGTNDTLRHAWRNGVSWQIEPVTKVSINGWNNGTDRSLRVGSDDCPRIAYHTGMDYGDDLYYAHRNCAPLYEDIVNEGSGPNHGIVCFMIPGGALFISPGETPVKIYSADGKLIMSGNLGKGQNRISLEQGVYLWMAGQYKGKVVVR